MRNNLRAVDDILSKILILDFSGRGGISHYIFCLSNALTQAGAHVRLLTTTDFELENQPAKCEYEKIFFPHRRRNFFFAKGLVYACSLARLMVAVRRHRPALVHFHETKLPRIEKKILSFLKKHNIRLVLTAHDVLHPERQKASKSLENLYRAFDHIIVHAEENRQALLRQFDLDTKIRIIPHGEYAFLSSKRIDKDDARQQLGIPFGKQVVLFFGYIRQYKGLQILIEALATARATIPNLFLLIVGETKENFKIYQNLIEQNNLQDHVHKTLEYVPIEKVPIYFSAADVVALPYISIYQSGVVQLAYAYRRAVIATTVGGLPEVVEDQKTGYLVPPNSPEKFADAICTAFADSDRLKKMGEDAHRTAKKKYSWTEIAKKTIEIYSELLSK